MILCDIGNTSIDIYHNGILTKYPIAEFIPESYVDNMYYISVNRSFSERVKGLSQWIDIEPWVDREKYYPTMGIDRIMVCEAVDDGVIVDAGSAVTVDTMQNGIYQGGFISLGIRSAQDAYGRLSSALESPFNFEVDLTIMAKNTPDSITLGYFLPLITSIRALGSPVYITGGDASMFLQWLDGAIMDEALIFKGMKKIIDKGSGC